MANGAHRLLSLIAALVYVPSCPLWADPLPGTTLPQIKPAAYKPGREIAKLANQAITESSGIACSRATPRVFWTHNDSGAAPRLFAFNLNGEDLGTYPLQGANAQDWEDICSYSVAGEHFLLVADTGDNAARRKIYSLYVIHERAMVGRQGKSQPLALFARQDFTYEDGPRNCESAAVDPVRREIVLVSKTSNPACKAYVLPLPSKKNPDKAVARPVATLTIPTTSAMDISPDGLRALVLTYGDAYEYTRQPGEDWIRGFARQPRIIKMPARAQGEAACYGADGVTIYLTSEKIPAPLLEVAPSNIEPQPPAPAPPSSLPQFKTVADAQKAAVGRYPDLGITHSKMNTEFAALYKRYQQQRPEYFRDVSWPIRLAEEAARNLKHH